MKLIYTALLLVFSAAMSAQDMALLQPKEYDGISGFKLYPNPVLDDVVYISSDNDAPKTVIIFDVFGEVMLKDRMLGKSLSISHLEAGVYVLQVTQNNQSITRKLVVK